jgi:Flp pilus assembly protein TadG
MNMRNTSIVKNERGQTIIIYALVVPILILFAGFAIDAARLYVVKAKLSTAVDGATLTGMKNLASGQTTASTLATNIFDANYGNGAPTPTVTFPTDTYGDKQVQVSATVNVDTFFMRYLSNWVAVPVSDTAVATRGKLVMSIVLDRSGSMCGGSAPCGSGSGDDGGEALQSAVPTFVGMFDNSLDEIALISFSDNTIINSSIGTGFQSPIDTAVAAMQFSGGTFGTGAGTGTVLSSSIGAPMSVADAQNTSVPIIAGSNVIKVLVYMTDGLMNTVQDNFHCGGTTNSTLTLINYGGYDSSSGNAVDFFDPTCTPNLSFTGCTNETGHMPYFGSSPECSSGCSSGFAYDTAGDICKDATGAIVKTFTPQQPGKCADGTTPPCAFTRTNITSEAQYRAIQTANTMRAESPVPTYIYTIGLGSSVSTATQAFLAQLANDPSSQWTSYYTYNKTQPQGMFQYVADCPSTQCTADLNNVFHVIAARVLLRLTQ